MASLLLLLVAASSLHGAVAIECYTGFKLLAGQTVGDQTIKCDNSGAQCYNITVAGGGAVLDLMKRGCSMWRCLASRDSCYATSIKDIPIKFCCCGTHLCNIDRNAVGAVNQKVGGWNAERPTEGEEEAVERVLGSDHAEKNHANMTLAEMRQFLGDIDVDVDIDNHTQTSTIGDVE